MHITVFGSGYVGLVTAACFSEAGHSVMCVDTDNKKIENLKKGIVPIFEPGLAELVKSGIKQNKLKFTSVAKEGIEFANLIFIAVGTPPDEHGSADLKYVLQVAETIGIYINSDKIVVNKSTVPVGSADKVKHKIEGLLKKDHLPFTVTVVSNPEFLKEGSAINDFKKPDRIIIGTDNDYAEKQMREAYAPFNRNHNKIIKMDIRSAELTKYVANAFLATKISFMNEMANLAERVDADIEQVRQGIGSDHRIGYDFIYAGCGYGGSCFPKDIRALIGTAKTTDMKLKILEAVEDVNKNQKEVLYQKIVSYFGNENLLKGKIFAIWGLAFKPNTDDIREAPSLTLIRKLLKAKARLRVFDPEAMEQVKKLYEQNDNVFFSQSKEEALENTDALMICTEWMEFKSLDVEIIKSKMKNTVIFDGRNMYNQVELKQVGVSYYGIGRC